MLSVRTSSSDKVLGLDLGADDYVAKPFDGLELCTSELFYYLEEKSGFEFPFKVYALLTFVDMILLILMNIPFLRFLIKHIDRPVRKIIWGLNHVSEENFSEKIDFYAKTSWIR